MAATGLEHLPGNDIDEILSRLPTKDAVRTSALSRSWRHRWKSIPDLDLSFVPLAAAEKTLRLHSAPVRHFKFKIENEGSKPLRAPSNLEPLFEAIARRSSISLRSIDISSRWSAFPLSTVAHCFPRLTLLELSDCVMQKPHRTTIFPDLRTLNMTDVELEYDPVGPEYNRVDHESAHHTVPMYIPTCPKLEKLSLEEVTLDSGYSKNNIHCDMDTIGLDFPRLSHLLLGRCHLNIVPSSLASLRVFHLFNVTVDGKLSALFSSCPSLETLILSYVHLVAEEHLHVSAPNLRLLKLADVLYDWGSLRDFRIANSPALETVLIDLQVECGSDERCNLMKVLGGMPRVKILKLLGWTIKFLHGGLVPGKLPTSFEHLTSLAGSSRVSI